MAFARRTVDEMAPEMIIPRYEHVPLVSYEVAVRDARPIVDELSLDREGFRLLAHKTAHAQERNTEVLRNKYVDELLPFIKDFFGASWVVAYRDPVFVRRAGGSSVPGVRGTAGMAHLDYMPIAAPMLAAVESYNQGIPIRSYSRLMIIQTWRAVSAPPQDVPLAVCDSSSVQESDIAVHDYTDAHRTWKSGTSHHSPKHRWHYFPNMTPNELLIFKGYDSDLPQSARVLHSAFDNRPAFPDATPRESIEARFYVYYE